MKKSQLLANLCEAELKVQTARAELVAYLIGNGYRHAMVDELGDIIPEEGMESDDWELPTDHIWLLDSVWYKNEEVEL